MSKIPESQIEHLAKLSALEFGADKLTKMKTDLEQILDFVQELDAADVSSVTLNEEVEGLDKLRTDEPEESLSTEKLLQNAPKTSKDCIVVPKVVE